MAVFSDDDICHTVLTLNDWRKDDESEDNSKT